jgi:hypothetical protein
LITTTKARSRIFGAVWGALLVATTFLICLASAKTASIDPDRYYHLAISRMDASGGLVHSIPQVEDLDWGAAFPDKEFLFHRFTSVAYRFHGDHGVIFLGWLLSCALIAVLYAGCLQITTPGRAALSTVLFTFLCPHFFARLPYLRPYVLAMTFFSLMLVGIIRKKPWLVGVCAALYCLSYHAFFIPGLLAALCFVFAFKGEAFWKRSFIFILLGILIGILINPYFPQNVQVMFTVIGESLDPKLNQIINDDFELIPLRFWDYLRIFSIHWALVVYASISFFKMRKELFKSFELQKTAFLLLASTLFLLLTLRSPRGTEYATPCCLFLAAYAAKAFKPRKSWVTASIFCFLILEMFTFPSFYGSLFTTEPERPQTAFKAIAAIPPAASGEKVFNCEWELGSFLLYARPDLKIVDLVNPHFLFEADPDKAILRLQLYRGVTSDAYSVIHDHFKARYAYCANRRVVEFMLKDPRFKLVFPLDDQDHHLPVFAPYVFEVAGS